MTKMRRLYDSMKELGATSQAGALTARQIFDKTGAALRMNLHDLSTYTAQLATTKRGVVARELVQVNANEPRRYRYWVTGPFVGWGVGAKHAATRRPYKARTRAEASLVKRGNVVAPGTYKLNVDGEDFLLERTISGQMLNRLMEVLLHTPADR